MKKTKINSIIRLLSVTLILISSSVGFMNTGENSDSKKVSVKIKIGNSNCTGSGICQITKVPKDQFSDVSGLTQEFYGLIGTTYGGDGRVIQTRTDWMSEQTYTLYFSGTNFVLESDFTIPANTIGNKNAITIQSGPYPIQRDGEKVILDIMGY